MLVMIVQNLQEHKEILDKMKYTPRYDFGEQLQEEDTAAQDLIMMGEDFYNNAPMVNNQIDPN